MIRQDFRKLAYYNSTLMTDNKGRAKFSFTLPDNCTTWRIMVVAVGENNLFGYGEESIVVKQPLTIRPVLPKFARYGDRFNAGFSITNGTEESLIVNTTSNILSDGALEIFQGESTQNLLKLRTGETKIKLFSFEAKSEGSVQLTFMGTAKTKDEKGRSVSDGISVPLTIRPIPPVEKLSCAGEMVDSVSYQINVPQDIRKDLGGVEIEVSNSILTTLKEPLDYLIEYPYGCLEQTLSRLKPLMHIRYLANNKPEIINVSSAALKDTIEKNLKKIVLLQHEDGGFKYWGSDDFSDKYLSIDVAYLYKLCKQYGYSFPVDTEKLTEYIISQMPIEFCYEENMKFKYSESSLFSLYGLSNLTKPDDCEIKHLLQIYNYKDSLCLLARLKLLALLNKTPHRKKALSELHEICNKIKVKENIVYFEESEMWDSIPFERAFYNSKNLAEAELIKLLLEMEPDNALIPKLVRYLISEMNQEGRWGNTYETSSILDAIAFYCKKYEADTSAYTLSLSANGKKLFQLSL